MTTEIQELPEVGEIVIATVSKVSDHGAYVTLDEYNNIQGFLHVSEIAPGWVRNISRYVKEGEKKEKIVRSKKIRKRKNYYSKCKRGCRSFTKGGRKIRGDNFFKI